MTTLRCSMIFREALTTADGNTRLPSGGQYPREDETSAIFGITIAIRSPAHCVICQIGSL
jgi:hypothetical protein